MALKSKDIVAVDVYLEFRKTRKFVGSLLRSQGKSKEYIFDYDKKYLYSPSPLSLGPDLPLTQARHKSKKLFDSFEDRIPSRKNPAYEEYCELTGVDKEEKNPIVLLPTIGRKGPSSFIFEPRYKGIQAIRNCEFRAYLDLSVRAFASIFEISTRTVQKIDSGSPVSRDIEKRIETYINFPEVAIWDVKNNGGILIDKKRDEVLEKLNELKERGWT